MAEPGRWGVDLGFHDIFGTWREAPAATVEAILESMGATAGPHPDDLPVTVQTVRLDHPLPPVPPGMLHLEQGGDVAVAGDLPPGLPPGYHRLEPHEGPPISFVVSPGLCPVPAERRWGWSVQLYATRSRRSWGMGDLGDLAQLTAWGAGLGAEVALLNPLHASHPGRHQEPSPYSPSSRCFANPLYLRVEDVPGAGSLPGLDQLAAAGRALNQADRIDRDAVWELKSQALEQIFERGGGAEAAPAGFDAFLAERGPALQGFATFNALAERHGFPWQEWPQELRRPDSPAVAAFAASKEGGRRVRFHAWLQWLVDRQLAAVEGTELISDLAIGVDGGGSDSWLWQDAFSAGMRVGAPPDEFNTLGQDWGLPPWDPWRLRGMAYEPFIETVRAGLRRTSGLRFDHVMGLFRLYWVPLGATPAEGAYVRYPYWDLLNILALEADRAGAYVVGEDLGTVQDMVREELAGRRVLSYKLLWFEETKPQDWRADALGAVTTHDLPTVAGLWTGHDLQVQRDLGLQPDEEAARGIHRRLEEWTGLPPDAAVAPVIEAAYGLLAEAPCRLLTVTLDDVAGAEERPNLPGTVDERPNWSIPLPLLLDELEGSPLPAAVAGRMAAGPAQGDEP